MGHWYSKNEEIETETKVENTVMQISGNVSLEEKVMMFIICSIKVIELVYMAYKIFHKKLKKKIEKNWMSKNPTYKCNKIKGAC